MTGLYPSNKKIDAKIKKLENLDRPMTPSEKEEYYDLKQIQDYDTPMGGASMRIQDKNKKFMV